MGPLRAWAASLYCLGRFYPVVGRVPNQVMDWWNYRGSEQGDEIGLQVNAGDLRFGHYAVHSALRFPTRNNVSVECSGFSAWDSERSPMIGRKVFRKIDNLPDMIRIVSDLAVDSLHDGMGFGADRDSASQISVGERLERIENVLPATFPDLQQFRARFWGIFKFRVAVAVGLFAIRSEKIHPAGAHISGKMFDDDRNGVGLALLTSPTRKVIFLRTKLAE
jgi:hypothetical protein